jgi:hypothetical protein
MIQCKQVSLCRDKASLFYIAPLSVGKNQPEHYRFIFVPL